MRAPALAALGTTPLVLSDDPAAAVRGSVTCTIQTAESHDGPDLVAVLGRLVGRVVDEPGPLRAFHYGADCRSSGCPPYAT